MISTVTLNPALDKTVYVTKLEPHDTNRISAVETDAGGKGINCSRMLKELGADTTAVAFLGGKTGDFIRGVLEREGIPVQFVATERPTRTCIAIEETTVKAPPTTLNEHGGPIGHKELVEFLEVVKNVARESSHVVFGGSVPMGVNHDIYKVMAQIAAVGGAKVVIDADGDALAEGIKSKPFMIKPNREEAERLLDAQFESKADVARAALKLAELDIPLVIISLGAQGAVACYEGRIFDAVPPKVDAVSTIGSGDSMVAGVICALEDGKGIEDALRLGCAAGAATAMSNGADIGQKQDVDRLLKSVKVTEIQPKT